MNAETDSDVSVAAVEEFAILESNSESELMENERIDASESTDAEQHPHAVVTGSLEISGPGGSGSSGDVDPPSPHLELNETTDVRIEEILKREFNDSDIDTFDATHSGCSVDSTRSDDDSFDSSVCSGEDDSPPLNPAPDIDYSSDEIPPGPTPSECDLSLLQSIKQEPIDNSNSLMCRVCEEPFQTLTRLLNHEKTCRGRGRPFKCTVCGKGFANKYRLIPHSRIHTGQKPYKCKVCGKAFRQDAHVKAHMVTHSGVKPHKCNKCKKSFVQKAQLIQHYRVHTGEKPFECDICGKRFNQQGNLYTHRKIHEEEKPYQCTQCDNSFRQKSQLAQHLRSDNAHVMIVVVAGKKGKKRSGKRSSK